MSLDWQTIPHQFHYLQNTVLDNRAKELGVAHYDSELGRHVTLAEKLSQVELADLARVHQEIRRREDNFAIIDMVKAVRKEGQTGRSAAWSIQHFLFVLQELAELGVKPFSEKLILAEKPPASFDWTILPPELAYLGSAVEQYSRLGSEGAILEWLDQASEAQLDELNSLAQRMFRDADCISAWSKQHRKTREEFRVYWMYLIFDHAGIHPE